jgi:hypothetical protein
LLDLQRDPGSVFLYRREPRELAERNLGVDWSNDCLLGSALAIRLAISSPPECKCGTRTLFLPPSTKFTTFLNELFSVPLEATEIGANVETWRVLSQAHPGTVVAGGGALLSGNAVMAWAAT